MTKVAQSVGRDETEVRKSTGASADLIVDDWHARISILAIFPCLVLVWTASGCAASSRGNWHNNKLVTCGLLERSIHLADYV